jgi:hypothetical protein
LEKQIALFICCEVAFLAQACFQLTRRWNKKKIMEAFEVGLPCRFDWSIAEIQPPAPEKSGSLLHALQR